MHSFHFLDFLLQRFIKRSSESEDKIKRLVYAFTVIPLQSLAQSLTTEEMLDLHFVQKVHQKCNKWYDEERNPKHETRVQHAVLQAYNND